ncbi:hypothetical protein Q8F57_039575 [Paraburkholderia terrae]|uniref:hypothetical protein n=1 Tax=Paraburkholderia terrae TaxID=311230 RepID=UPI00296B4B3F|nr:hypothetical protein [Paraburkholderia terrae]MDW3658686.1 hypothetical protein [Paraburkholderia terrae]
MLKRTSRSGRKPSVAFEAESVALLNIQTKSEILDSLLLFARTNDENRRKVHDGLQSGESKIAPTTLRQFLKWDNAQKAYALLGKQSEEIRRIGNGTLDRNPGLYIKVVQALAELDGIRKASFSSPETSLAKLRRELKSANAQISILQTELIILRLDLKSVEVARDNAKRQFLELKKKFINECTLAGPQPHQAPNASITKLKEAKNAGRHKRT